MGRTKSTTKVAKSKKSKRNNITKIAKSIERRGSKKRVIVEDDRSLLLLPTPSTLFNCACSDDPFGAFDAGHMINLIGDSSSGKTMFALGTGAEIFYSPKLREYDYKIVLDDVENANTFNMPYLFGREFAEAIEAPSYEVVDGDTIPVPSRTIEDFHFNICDHLEGDRPIVYILDSFDALDAEQDIEKLESMREARRKGQKAKGTYAMAKPKKASELLRHICGRLKETNSLLIIISQTRDNIDAFSFEKRTRSGGRALKFYAHHEIWLAMAGKIKSKGHVIGNSVLAKITKNKITGKQRDILFPIFYDYGVDDIRSMIDWMTKEKFWKQTKQTINAKDMKMKATAAKLIKTIESCGYERKVQRLVGKKWIELENSLRLDRKPRYRRV